MMKMYLTRKRGVEVPFFLSPGKLKGCRKTVRGELRMVSASYLLAVCLEEGSRVTLQEKSAAVRPYHGLLLSPEKEVQLYSPKGTAYLFLSFDAETVLYSCLPALAGNQGLADFFLNEGREEEHLSFLEIDSMTEPMTSMMEMIVNASGDETFLEEETFLYLLTAQGLLCELFSAISRQCYLQAILKHGLGEALFEKICACMLRTGGQASLNEVAGSCYCHTNTVTRILQRYTGMSYSRFRQLMRISFSAKHLREGNMSVQEAAAQCGYLNMTNFYRQFREVYRIGPGEYRVLFL